MVHGLNTKSHAMPPSASGDLNLTKRMDVIPQLGPVVPGGAAGWQWLTGDWMGKEFRDDRLNRADGGWEPLFTASENKSGCK